MPNYAPRLLIIDDQPSSVCLLLAYLGDKGIDILVALDGRDGFKKAIDGQPDLILLDVTMPVMDGFTLCERLKAEALTADIPVIFLSASVALEDKLRGFAAGAVDYITKPFSEQEVLARVYVHLGNRPQRTQPAPGLPPLLAEGVEGGPSREQQLFDRAVTALQHRLASPPGLTELAHEIGTNERKLTEIFRRRLGMTVFDFLLDIRLEKSRLMLENEEMQIQLIADRIGYRNAGDFTRAFRRRYGVSPSEYRRARGAEVADEATR
jgi:DNA-binding response OmpR family regulator